jgi:DNA repair exonuclease SbcCD ATPase subunit
LATQQKDAAEAQQMAAAEAEDFELADRMGTVIDGHERERSELLSILENIGRALKQLEQQRQQEVDGVAKCFQNIQAKLKSFQKEQESKDTEDAAASLRRFSTLSKQLSAENERLQQDLKHIEKDEDLVAEERKELEKSISEQSGTYEKLRDEAKDKLKTVEEEIEELRKQLAAKQTVAAQLRTEYAGHDEAVLKVRVKFARQLTRVQKKESTIKDNKEEMGLEQASYDRQKQAHDAEVAEHSEALLARDQLLDALSKEVEMADTFESIVAKEIGFEAVSEEGGESNDDLTQLRAEVVKCEAAIGEAKEYLIVTSSVLASLEEECTSLDSRIPQLEETKKAAATRRDFKAAGKASKEIKEATARLEECKDQLMDEAEERKTTADADLKKLEDELEEKRKLSNEKEKVSGLASMESLANNIKRLIATKHSVCGDARENSIQSVGAFVLDSQIKALRMEGQTYGDKFGGWNELMAEIGEEETDDSPAQETEDGESGETAEKDTAETEKETPQSEPTQAKPVEEESQADKMASFRKLTVRLKEVEDALETAAANEDYDEAAELDEEMQQILLDFGALDLTEEEMDAALTDPPVESVPTSTSDDAALDGDGATDHSPEEEESSDPPIDVDVKDAEETPEESPNDSPEGDEEKDAEATQEESPDDSPDDEAGESNVTEESEQALGNGLEDKNDVSNGDALSNDGNGTIEY